MPATTAETLSLVTRNVSVAPLVLLSAADHYGRQAKGTRKRVVGVLLGQNDGQNVRVSNSFAGGWPIEDLVAAATVPQVGAAWEGAELTRLQFRSRKTRKTLRCGSWTTTTSSR